ncbi:Spore coat protein SA [compost metagenome]
MGRQKVAIITPGSFVIPSGRSSSVERVIEKVAPLGAEQLEISIYGPIGEGLPSAGNIGSVPCFRLPAGQHYADSVLMHLRKWLPDVIDVHNRPMLAYKLKRGLSKAKVFLTLHSTTFISPAQYTEIGIHQMLHSLDGLIVNSEYLKNIIIERFPSLKTKTYVNHLGVSLEDFLPRWTTTGESLRSARLFDLGWSDRKIVLYVGRLLPSKGVHYLLEAWPSIMSREPKAMLLIVGSAFYSGDRETSYVRKLKSMAEPLGDRIVFLPFVPYPQIAVWYNLADVVAVPSTGEEAFGLVNVEAMASAVPIVAADNGGIPEIVNHGVSGYLIPTSAMGQGFTSSILRLLSNEAERRRMGRAGRELARNSFRWQHTASRWLDLMSRDL